MEDPLDMDCSWEFNAPQFVDFSTAHDEDESADQWFDVDHENEDKKSQLENVCNDVDIIEDAEVEIEKLEGTPKQEARRLTRSKCQTPVNEKGLPEATEKNKDAKSPQAVKEKLNESMPSNLCTLSGWKKRTKARTSQQMEVKRKSPPQLKKGVHLSRQKSLKRLNRSLEGEKRNPVIKTAPVKNTEQKELETIAQFRQKLSKQLKQNQESFKKAVVAPSYVPPHSKAKPTHPQEFKFETDNRIKNQATEPQSGSSPVDYVRTLRSNSKSESQPAAAKSGLTCPKPFNLSGSRKRKISQSTDKLNDSYHSTAEKLIAFHKQTPDRFRSKPRAGRVPVMKKSHIPSTTIPVTPQLETRCRSRPQHVPSHHELEEHEVEEMKKNQFKAHPVNQKILQNPCTGVKKVASKPPTQIEEFHLEGPKRGQNRSLETKEEKFEFHAQPVPKDILEGPVGVKQPKPKPVTIPQSPAFALRHRVRMPIEVPEEQEANKSYGRKKVPHTGVPFQPALSHKTTVPQPFGFEEREKLRMAHKAAKTEQILAEEQMAREFKANPLPSPTADILPPRHTKPTTKPEPFHLDTDCRLNRSDERKRQIEEELHPKVQFKARPPEVLRNKPFIPEKSSKPLTDISEFSLNTERRAVVREDFEMHKKGKEAEIEAVKRRIEREKEEEEERAIAKLRAEMVHKSNPIKKYKNVEVQPSDKPVTSPITPKFETDRRLRSKVRV